MNSDLRDLFRELEPPQGGAERFAARLDAETRASPAVRSRRAVAAAAACVAVALVATIVLRQPDDPQVASGAEPTVDVYNAPELDRLLGRPLRATEITVMVGDETLPVTRLDTANQKVRMYRIDEPAPAP